MKKLSIILLLFIALFTTSSPCGASIKNNKLDFKKFISDKLKLRINNNNDKCEYSLSSLSSRCTKVTVLFEDGRTDKVSLKPFEGYDGICLNHEDKIVGVGVCDREEEFFKYREADLIIYIGINKANECYLYAHNKGSIPVSTYFLLDNNNVFILHIPSNTKTDKKVFKDDEIVTAFWFGR